MPNQTAATQAGTGVLLVSLVISLILLIFFVIVYWKIFSKAGYSGALSLLIFIPIVGFIAFLIALCVLAFGEWPIHRELNQLRLMAGSRPPQYPQNPPYPPPPLYS